MQFKKYEMGFAPISAYLLKKYRLLS